MTRAADWFAATRPRTLSASLTPVAVGIGVARSTGHVVVWHAALALVVGLSIQLGANFANDYSDGVRGTDARRVGPTRLVGSGLASPAAVRAAAIASFGLGAAAGLVLAIVVSPWLILVGAASIAAAWLYTGGPHPYGYAGYGELFAFVFFGFVATVGTTYVVSGQIPAIAWGAAVPLGAYTTAIMVVNNLRDVATDVEAGKYTLEVRLGDRRSRLLFVVLVVGGVLASAVVAPWRHFALLALLALPAAALLIRRVRAGATGTELVTVLKQTGAVHILLGLLLAIGIAL
ncbi:MAG: 1,4-dihydroxy-2-naphthoate polyprenyltransferase [Acidimicrobiales bacterium]